MLLALIFMSIPHAIAADVLEGCQSEACDCFEEYKVARKTGFEIKTIRPFTLYERMSRDSKVLGKFDPGVKAKPGKFRIVFSEPGEYLVEQSKNAALSIGDKVRKKVYLGEGVSKVQKNGKWIEFGGGEVQLKTIRETKLEEWLEVSIHGHGNNQSNKETGYTLDAPFENCLE